MEGCLIEDRVAADVGSWRKYIQYLFWVRWFNIELYIPTDYKYDCIAQLTIIEDKGSIFKIFKVELVMEVFYDLVRHAWQILDLFQQINLACLPGIVVLFWGLILQSVFYLGELSTQIFKVFFAKDSNCTLIFATNWCCSSYFVD